MSDGGGATTGGVTGLGGDFFRARDPDKLKAWYERALGVPAEDLMRSDGLVFAIFEADTDYFGPETTVRLKLAVPPELAGGKDHRYPGGGEIITIRHWNASIARPGMELCLRVVGEGVAFPLDD